ncbi:response regulator transcription factor [Myroides marinus]|uniref:LytR/AlgR family response regulator transcription factor n=1 Tax=Myroides marinus TaxID=703342 RepID=UPI0025773170|nr:response regulator [Myroides marinus]MDM1349620.1 response regulator transcription factor [Myroides marinus]MDM1354437.1 response regulator transcription factor [Myroides marinus]MDM1356829.1 response regulator transcription factor [Myroides marinus]MDM1364403.1 response regulator transcription factor [Myroides marinus]MDM1533898.1 response regulator transcription factor [Myroides marinus]
MISKLKCILLDDEMLGLKYLKMLCEQIEEIEVVRTYDNPTVFLEELPQLEFDVAILDINMPGMDGLSVAQLLHNKGVIFVTAYKEYALEAFEIEAIDYIAKPIKKERLYKAVLKAMRQCKPIEDVSFMTINSNKGKALLHFSDILYIKTNEIDSRDKDVYLDNNQVIVAKNMSLDKFVSVLPSSKFCQINKGELIALRIVRFFSHDLITTMIKTLEGKPLELTLGMTYKTDFLEKI